MSRSGILPSPPLLNQPVNGNELMLTDDATHDSTLHVDVGQIDRLHFFPGRLFPILNSSCGHEGSKRQPLSMQSAERIRQISAVTQLSTSASSSLDVTMHTCEPQVAGFLRGKDRSFPSNNLLKLCNLRRQQHNNVSPGMDQLHTHFLSRLSEIVSQRSQNSTGPKTTCSIRSDQNNVLDVGNSTSKPS